MHFSKPKGIYYVTLSLCQKNPQYCDFLIFCFKSPHIKLIPYRFWSYQLVSSGWMWNVSLQASIFEQRIKVIFNIYCFTSMCLVELLIYFILESLKILKQIMRKTYTVLWNRKVTGHYFFAEKERKKNLLYKQTPVIMISKKVVII